MSEQNRNVLVGVFAILGMTLFGWLVFKFGDLPSYFSQVDSQQVTIIFSDIAGIEEGTSVLFRGYSVGLIAKVNPPIPVKDKKDPSLIYYQATVVANIAKKHPVPDNVVPTIFKRGLGSSYIDLVLKGAASGELLAEGSTISGVISEGSEFLSEKTQDKLDKLVDGVNQLTISLQNQLVPRLPKDVDHSDNDDIHPNLATAIVRMDNVLKNLDVYLGDSDNQQNFKKALSEFSALGTDVRSLVGSLDKLALEASTLVKRTTKTVDNIDQTTTQVNHTVASVGKNVQTVADEMAADLRKLGIIFQAASQGKGTVGLLLNDPRLYETLTDTSDRLGKAVDEFKKMTAQWKAEGVIMDLK